VILAVDGGNSKTDLALVDSDGRLLAALRGPTTSHQRIGFEPGIERMAGLVADLRDAAGLEPDAACFEIEVGAGEPQRAEDDIRRRHDLPRARPPTCSRAAASRVEDPAAR